MLLLCDDSEWIDKEFNAEVSITLKTVYLEDPAFPSFTPEFLETALGLSTRAMAMEFNVKGISFATLEVRNLDQFLKEVIGSDKIIGNPVNIFNPEFFPMTMKQKKFFSSYTLDELNSFIPDKKIDTIEQFYEHLCTTWAGNMEKFKSLEINGTTIFTPDKLKPKTWTGWKTLLQYQTEYDLFITNTPVLADDLDTPYPHVIFDNASLIGMADSSPGAPNGRKTAVMASGISYLEIPPFSEEDILSELRSDYLPDYLPGNWMAADLGIYIIAHEFGHALFGLPDAYDHPRHCLMNKPPENLDVTFLEHFMEHREPCPDCRENLNQAKCRWLRGG